MQDVIQFLINNADVLQMVKEGTASLVGVSPEELKAILEVFSGESNRSKGIFLGVEVKNRDFVSSVFLKGEIMNSFIKKNIIVLLPIFLFCVVPFIPSVINFKYPLVGIEVIEIK